MIKNTLTLLILLCFIVPRPVYAQTKHTKQHLTTFDIQRLKTLKQSLDGVDQKTLQQSIDELERTSYPQLNLSIKEAMAKTYMDLVNQENVKGQAKKQWLYSMIALNMAYLQFAGEKDSAAGAKNLNKLIRHKLKEHLPAYIFNQPGFQCSIG